MQPDEINISFTINKSALGINNYHLSFFPIGLDFVITGSKGFLKQFFLIVIKFLQYCPYKLLTYFKV